MFFDSVTFLIVSKFFWILTYIPFVPATPFQFILALWILLPQNEGEKVIYLMLSSYFVKFEEKMTKFRSIYLVLLLTTVLKVAVFITEYCSKRIAAEKLSELRSMTEQMDQVLLRQIKVRGGRKERSAPSSDQQAEESSSPV